jgi:hypothetical protein
MFMRMVHFICLLALLAGASLYRPDRANAQGTPDQQQACAPDAMRLCSDAMPDVVKIKARLAQPGVQNRDAGQQQTCVAASRDAGGAAPRLRSVHPSLQLIGRGGKSALQ